MTAPSTFRFSLACGTGSSYIDVTGDVLFEEGNIPFSEGRDSQFDDVHPGVFSFTLANGGGKYTPGNPLTTLAVPLSEGMGAVMELDGLLFAGTVRGVAVLFPPKELADSARVRVTVDDMLGNMARRRLPATFGASLVTLAQPYLWWPLDDEAGSSSAREATGNWHALQTLGDPRTVYGVAGVPGIGSPQIITYGALGIQSAYPPLTYLDATSMGVWGCWITPVDNSTSPQIGVTFDRYPVATTIRFGLGGDLYPQLTGTGGTVTASAPVSAGDPHYFELELSQVTVAGTTTLRATASVDGVAWATSSARSSYSGVAASGEAASPTYVFLVANSVAVVAGFSNLSLTARPTRQELLLSSDAAGILGSIIPALPEVTLDILPALARAPMEIPDTSGSVLDTVNSVIRAEQGAMYSETTGTLTSPVEKIKILPRNRARAIDYTFDVAEILDPIPFVHSLIDTVSEFTATGPNDSATYQDPTVVPLVGSASSSDSVPLRDRIDLYAYASDRATRGPNRGITIPSITIDATSPFIDRWADFSAIRQGHRLHITGLPAAQLGYSTWDGFVIGRDIVNTQDSQTDEPKTLFTYYLAPWAPVAVYDTARYSAGGTLTLQSNISASATSMGLVSTGALVTTNPAHFPLEFQFASGEIVTVSGVSGVSSPQTAALSARGVASGRPAAAHTVGEAIDLAQIDRYAY